MESKNLLQLLEALADGRRTPESVAAEIVNARTTPLTGCSGSVEARIDHDRTQRCGMAEVIYAEGKTPEQVAFIMDELSQRSPVVLATRATSDHMKAVSNRFPDAVYHETARVIELASPTVPLERIAPEGLVVVVSAGTSDIPVAEEAAIVAAALGCRVERLYDVGVAGMHRALEHSALLNEARVVIAVAGMEGALPSILGGLVRVPVIAVPTSVGYGAHLDGFAPLLTMLNSCAAGISVVNIDNGFGAAVLAARINNPHWIENA